MRLLTLLSMRQMCHLSTLFEHSVPPLDATEQWNFTRMLAPADRLPANQSIVAASNLFTGRVAHCRSAPPVMRIRLPTSLHSAPAVVLRQRPCEARHKLSFRRSPALAITSQSDFS